MQTETDISVHPLETEDTHDRILAAAQKLFSDKGYDATSVRDITSEAGCNVASVNYHFGGKDKLYLETFRSMLTLLRDRRLEMMGDLMARKPSPTLDEFVQTFATIMLEPLVDDDRGRMFLNIVTREMIAPRLPPGVLLEEFLEPMMERSTAALAKVGPQLDPVSARMCVMSMVGQLLHSLRAHHLLADLGRTDVLPLSQTEQLRHFVRFSVGGIHACAADPLQDSLPEVTQ
ncbi:MAG: CerR family C-terminal domain-containing protein [Acidobacteriota bacterium]|nr:CerR family C-terminal domain-containing protein [Acidobacteriota bacterium]